MNWLKSAKQHISQGRQGRSPFLRIYEGHEAEIDLFDIYRNQACFFVASGPGFKKIDPALLKKPGIITLGVNNSAKSFRPNIWVSVDSPGRFLESVWRDPTIMKFCGTGKWKQPIWDHKRWEEAGFPAANDFYSSVKVQDCPNVYHIKRNNEFDASKFLTEETINWGNHKNRGGCRSVMVASVKIMYALGFRRVYFVGVDFKMDGDNPYSFNEQRTNGAVRGNTSSYRKMISYFSQLAPYFKAAGYDVRNCTPNSDLTIFPFMPLEEAVEKELAEMPDPETEQTMNMYIPDR